MPWCFVKHRDNFTLPLPYHVVIAFIFCFCFGLRFKHDKNLDECYLGSCWKKCHQSEC